MKRNQRQGLFRGYWYDQAGRKLRRVTRPELAEAYRLMALGRRLGLHVETQRRPSAQDL